jgi:2-polyprenyl-6-hydroxyphenyl methylase/3-demethylubiquinone-9 3-methyltransferase
MQKTERNKSNVFAFGKNWHNFLRKLSEEKIETAKQSLISMLGCSDLQGFRFLDAGCGSGLFSLAALRLGAAEVISFDVDKESVACAQYLNNRFGPFPNWKINLGSVLDRDWLLRLGKFHIVYSWGVLHHTGFMWQALYNITIPVDEGGFLYISIYNDQGINSKFWKQLKRLYNIVPSPIKFIMAGAYFLFVLIIKTVQGIIRFRPPSLWYGYGNERGMDLWHDVVDWIGGYPFETATPAEIIRFFKTYDFSVTNMIRKTGMGCNEFVFRRSAKEKAHD